MDIRKKEVRPMKHKLISILAAMTLLLAGCGLTTEGTPNGQPSASPSPETTKDSESIVILHTNDVHCAVNDNIGYDGLYLYKEEMLQKYENVLLVDAGDAIQGSAYGTLSKGKLIIDLMNDVGYDCATLGNHEFDYGMDVLDDRSEQLNCGYICSNFCTADGETVFEPYRIFEIAGKKIAFVGVDTPSTFTKSPIALLTDDQGAPMYDFMADETGEKLTACVQKNVDDARSKGADFVILLAHLGNGDGDEPRFHSKHLIAQTNGIDVLIDGHSHEKVNEELINKDGKTVLSSQTGTKLKSIGKITISADNTISTELVEEVPEPEGIAAELVTRNKTNRWVDSKIKKQIEEYTASYQELMNRKIGEVAFSLIVNGEDNKRLAKLQETGLMNLICDALCEIGESDISLLYGGACRADIEQGDILLTDVLQAFPYSNDVVVASMKGEDILNAVEFGARRLPAECNGLIHGSGIEYTVDLSIPSSVKENEKGEFVSVDGEYRVREIRINGEPLDKDKTYIVTTNTYLQGGGDGMAMMKNTEILRTLQYQDNTLLAEYIETNLNGVVPETYSNTEGRIRIIP